MGIIKGYSVICKIIFKLEKSMTTNYIYFAKQTYTSLISLFKFQYIQDQSSAE